MCGSETDFFIRIRIEKIVVMDIYMGNRLFPDFIHNLGQNIVEILLENTQDRNLSLTQTCVILENLPI